MGAGQLPAGGVRGGFLVDTGRARAVESRTGARDGENPRVNDEHDTHDLPGPSLWPIGFAIGVACVLIGLVISIPVLIVGAVVALVFGFLWVRDLFVSHPVTAAAAGLHDHTTATSAHDPYSFGDARRSLTAFEPWKEVMRQLLAHHASNPQSPLQMISTEIIPFPDYGAGAKYSLFDDSVALVSWLRSEWASAQARVESSA